MSAWGDAGLVCAGLLLLFLLFICLVAVFRREEAPFPLPQMDARHVHDPKIEPRRRAA